MTSPYDRLGISPEATPAQVKAAYHAKLKEFPAHIHPEDFKAIRAAYEAIRSGAVVSEKNFLQARPLEATIDAELLQQLREKAIALLAVSLDDMIRETF